MGRGRKIEVWKHPKYGDEVDIRMDPESGKFFGTLYGVYMQNGVLADLRTALRVAVEKNTGLDWQAVIEVKVACNANTATMFKSGTHEADMSDDNNSQDSANGKLSLVFERYWVAQLRDKNWVRCTAWHSQDDEGNTDNYAPGRALHDPLPRRLNSSPWREHGIGDMKDFSIPFTLPSKSSSFDAGQTTYWVPYTEGLWNGLQFIVHKLALLHDNLLGVLGTDEGRGRIARFLEDGGMPLLPASTKEN